MIYCKIPEYDVCVMLGQSGRLGCFMCSFGDLMETVFYAESTQEMLDHLSAHDKKGDSVPLGLHTQLVNDDLTNFPNNPMTSKSSS